jgi:hypothetical protein
VYDKLGVADRLELALYCLNSRILDGAVKENPLKDAPPKPPAVPKPSPHNSTASAIPPTIPDTPENLS